MLRYSSVGALLLGLSMTGCATHTGTGALAGGLLGAGAGAAIGSMTGNAGAGALIGSGLGAASGGLVGAGLDENDQRNAARVEASEARILSTTAASSPNPLAVNEIIQMSQSGVSEDVIITSIQSSNAIYSLSATNIVELHNQGVSDRVIQAMLDSARRPATVVRRQPVIYQAAPVYVVEPPPRVSVGFGYGFGPCYHRRHCW